MNQTVYRTTSRATYNQPDLHVNGTAVFIFTMLLLIDALGTTWMAIEGVGVGWLLVFSIGLAIIATYILVGWQMAKQWEKAVVLRFGKFKALKGPPSRRAVLPGKELAPGILIGCFGSSFSFGCWLPGWRRGLPP